MPIKQQPKKSAVKTKPLPKKKGVKKIILIISTLVCIVILVLLFFLLGNKSTKNMNKASESAIKDTSLSEKELSDSQVGTRLTLTKAKLSLASINNKDILKVIIDKPVGNDNEKVEYKFDWSVNGRQAGDGSDSLSEFKRGDKVLVKVTPFEGEKVGESRFLEIIINNTTPKVVNVQDSKYDGKIFSCQVKGVDQDGDALTYSLEEAPQGMTINSQTGLITWQPKEGDYGDRDIKVKLSDNKGGITIQTVKISITKPSDQNKQTENKK